jgi:hypothetical protein
MQQRAQRPGAALAGKHGVGLGHFQRRELERPERDRRIRLHLIACANPGFLPHRHHAVVPGLLGDLHRGNVA